MLLETGFTPEYRVHLTISAVEDDIAVGTRERGVWSRKVILGNREERLLQKAAMFPEIR